MRRIAWWPIYAAEEPDGWRRIVGSALVICIGLVLAVGALLGGTALTVLLITVLRAVL
jgi:hypothetical protein